MIFLIEAECGPRTLKPSFSRTNSLRSTRAVRSEGFTRVRERMFGGRHVHPELVDPRPALLVAGFLVVAR
jgi:hypothetical protein